MQLKPIFWPIPLLGSLLILGCVPKVKPYLEPTERTVAGGREFELTVPQGELKAEIQAARGGAGLGLIGALIDVGVENSRTKDAESAIQGVRDALIGYDFDHLVLARTKATVARLDWLGCKDVVFAKENSDDKRNEWLDKAKTPQVVYLDCSYALSPDFGSMQVYLAVSIARKEAPAGMTAADRLKPGNLVLLHHFTSVVPLAAPSKDTAENAKRWAADKGKQARAGLELALANGEMMLEQCLQQDAAAALPGATGENVTTGSFTGKLIARSKEGTLVLLPTQRWVFMSATQL